MSNEQVEQHPPRSGEPLFRYIAEQYQALQQEPVLYQWMVTYLNPDKRLMGGGVFLVFMVIAIAMGTSGKEIATQSFVIFSCFAVIMGAYVWFLICANKIYHYHITAKGIYYTLQDDIPEIAFTIMRGVGWVGCIACVLAAGLLGPAAFIGAGASALLAWKIKDMKPELKEEVCLYSNGDKAELTLFEKGRAIKLHGREHISEFGVLYCLEGEYQKVLKLLYPYLDNYEVHEVDSWREF
ncbi:MULTISPECIES: hypothetical protein [Aeromonas]|uniref:hypothetical protein n=1 Tax=Aeromonas TaxID=642 RepID=UPI001CBE0E7A|nr:hypothetical protein [Aeromonas enteropelogenes]UAK71111.1 hypothetical protein K8O95_15745 [Aeromonas enteropelogenes]